MHSNPNRTLSDVVDNIGRMAAGPVKPAESYSLVTVTIGRNAPVDLEDQSIPEDEVDASDAGDVDLGLQREADAHQPLGRCP